MDEVLYRKYRPQSFDDVYGQDHVKTVLIQSIKHQKVSHAYLFSGPRGSGKTTVARIMSRELGVSGVDVSEIDAASHRGIDDVRNLRESVSFQPTGSERKMYILDEVHMLTNEAFNALLKTLEEPPAHAFFILCTTEPHKVPQTILSRCMHLPFKKATTEQLAQFIIEYSKREGVRLHPDSATLLAAHADGAYRDALVLLEKVIGLCIKGEVSPSDIEKRVGIVGQDFADDLLKAKIEGKVADKNPDKKKTVKVKAKKETVANKILAKKDTKKATLAANKAATKMAGTKKTTVRKAAKKTEK